MKTFKFFRAVAIASASFLFASAYAAPVIYFGENQTPNFGVSGDPLTARNLFLSGLAASVGNETFEAFAAGTNAPVNLVFSGSGGNLNATLSGSGAILDVQSLGRYNTSTGGQKYWSVSGAFEIDFGNTPVAAFGFYGTDIGDFDGQLIISLTDTNDVVTNLQVANTIDGNNGALLFWGFIDNAKSYKRITFSNTNAGTDVFGFDDMVIGDLRQAGGDDPRPMPEPGTLALAGLSLLALGGLRRRRIG